MDLDIGNLLLYSFGGSSDCEKTSEISDTCLTLFRKDYECEILENVNGALCGTYPSKMFIPMPTKRGSASTKLEDYVTKAKLARTRGRFVAPVLIVNNKYICRSATLALSPEIYARQTYGYWMQGEVYKQVDATSVDSGKQESTCHESGETKPISWDEEGNDWMVDKLRNADVNLLQYLKVNVIFDYMVENMKVKYGMNVTSSEKVDDSGRYAPFHLLAVPYPGCEFFTEYRNCGHNAEELKYDWNQAFVDATLRIPATFDGVCNIDWADYVNWDLATLTQNYLLLQLRLFVHKDSNGILLHCISGWDRTPLFVSLMRLSLWADGLAHESLDAREMAYFTIAYDWLLFQHQFGVRIANGEDIFFFCFDFLKHICGDEFSLPQNQITEGSSFTNGSVKHVSNGNGVANGAQPDLLTTSDNGIAIPVKDNLVTLPDKAEESYVPQDCNTGTCNDDTGVQTAVLCVQSAVEHKEDGSDDSTTSSYRTSRLMEVRSLVVEAYKETMETINEKGQNHGIAATLLNRLTSTLGFVKK